MATKTSKYELQKKEDNDFYNIEDLNANWDKVENALTEFDDSGTAEGITSFTDMLAKLVTGNKLAVTLRNLKAGLQFVLHTGSIVNNCVTDNAKLPLSAAQGKALQDAITKLNSDLPGRAKIANISSLASIGDIFKTYSKNGSIPVIGIINWDVTLAPDQNVTIAFVWNYLIVAISSSGCIYTASPNAATWQKRN